MEGGTDGLGMAEHKSETAESTGFLEPGAKFEGTLETKGMFRIDSQMKGTLVSREVLILGEHAEVEGEILGNQVMISGKFQGTIRASSRVEIQAKAIRARGNPLTLRDYRTRSGVRWQVPRFYSP